MRHSALWIPLGLALAHVGCDDTARAVKQEAAEAAGSTERAADDAKRELSDAGARLKREAEHAADRVKEAVDDTDRALADKIRGDEPDADVKEPKK